MFSIPISRSLQTPIVVLCTQQWLLGLQQHQQSFWRTSQTCSWSHINIFSWTKTIIRIMSCIIPVISNVCPGFSSLYPRPTHCRPTSNETVRCIMPSDQEESSPCYHMGPTQGISEYTNQEHQGLNHHSPTSPLSCCQLPQPAHPDRSRGCTPAMSHAIQAWT